MKALAAEFNMLGNDKGKRKKGRKGAATSVVVRGGAERNGIASTVRDAFSFRDQACVGRSVSPLEMLFDMFESTFPQSLIEEVFEEANCDSSATINYLLSLQGAAAVPDPPSQRGGQSQNLRPMTDGSFFSRLPLDAMLAIADMVDMYQLARLSRVSHSCLLAVNETFKATTSLAIKSGWASTRTDDTILRMLARFPSLRTISLKKCSNFESFASLPMAVKTANLTSICFAGCIWLADTDIRALVPSLGELVSLDLSQCTYLSDDTLDSVSELPRLKKLLLCECTGFTTAGVVELLQRAPVLEKLDLKGCTKLTSGVLNVPRADLPLTNLNISHCRMTSLVFAPWTRGSKLNRVETSSFSNLQHLSLSSNTQLSAVAVHLPSLQTLSLASCKQLRELSLRTPSLQSLNLSMCLELERVHGLPLNYTIRYPVAASAQSRSYLTPTRTPSSSPDHMSAAVTPPLQALDREFREFGGVSFSSSITPGLRFVSFPVTSNSLSTSPPPPPSASLGAESTAKSIETPAENDEQAGEETGEPQAETDSVLAETLQAQLNGVTSDAAMAEAIAAAEAQEEEQEAQAQQRFLAEYPARYARRGRHMLRKERRKQQDDARRQQRTATVSPKLVPTNPSELFDPSLRLDSALPSPPPLRSRRASEESHEEPLADSSRGATKSGRSAFPPARDSDPVADPAAEIVPDELMMLHGDDGQVWRSRHTQSRGDRTTRQGRDRKGRPHHSAQSSQVPTAPKPYKGPPRTIIYTSTRKNAASASASVSASVSAAASTEPSAAASRSESPALTIPVNSASADMTAPSDENRAADDSLRAQALVQLTHLRLNSLPRMKDLAAINMFECRSLRPEYLTSLTQACLLAPKDHSRPPSPVESKTPPHSRSSAASSPLAAAASPSPSPSFLPEVVRRAPSALKSLVCDAMLQLTDECVLQLIKDVELPVDPALSHDAKHVQLRFETLSLAGCKKLSPEVVRAAAQHVRPSALARSLSSSERRA